MYSSQGSRNKIDFKRKTKLHFFTNHQYLINISKPSFSISHTFEPPRTTTTTWLSTWEITSPSYELVSVCNCFPSFAFYSSPIICIGIIHSKLTDTKYKRDGIQKRFVLSLRYPEIWLVEEKKKLASYSSLSNSQDIHTCRQAMLLRTKLLFIS